MVGHESGSGEIHFDRLRWDLIKDTLVDAGLPGNLVRVIMNSISSSSMQIFCNGNLSEPFTHVTLLICTMYGRPLSSYHFKSPSWTEEWQAIQMARPHIFHTYFYTDDLILFGTTEDKQIDLILIKAMIEDFCHSSGQ